MKTRLAMRAATFGAIAVLFLFVSNSLAECGGVNHAKVSPSSWQMGAGQLRLLPVAAASDDAAIVGFWHVKFVSEGSAGIPNGTEIDAGYAQWHSDHTEITNSGGRPPITSNFCLGVWKSVGGGEYKLNHFGISWDPTGTTLIGPGIIREDVTLGASGNSFTGDFTIDQYDESGNNLAHLQGVISGTRISVDTPESSIF